MKSPLFNRLLALLFTLTVAISAVASGKPTLWIYSDLSDPRDRRKGGHPQNDPDDICAAAALLLSANRFHIAAFVYSSNHRVGLADATDFVQTTLAAAYAHDQPRLDEAFGGYQREIPFLRSSVNHGGPSRRFDRNADYRDLTGLETVRGLVELASREPVYVLNWGPLTESAMAVQHCLTTGNETALKNMTFISHWTKSLIAQGTPTTPFKVANCNDDASACAFMHETAAASPLVKFYELGSVGQGGIVDGGGRYPRYDEFQHSRLGQIFVNAKFYGGKPDQSDAATFWILAEGFGPTLADYASDGGLDQATETKARDLFKASGHKILDDLLARSNAAATTHDPFPEAFIAARFVYVYQYLDGRYSLYTALPATYEIRSATGEVVLHDSVGRGDHKLTAFAGLPAGRYSVKVTCAGLSREFALDRANP
jgi:hypothetical protein